MPPEVKRIFADLCPPIFDGDAIALVRVVGFASRSEALEVETGVLDVVVIEDLRPRTLATGFKTSFAFARDSDPMARAFNRANAWNTLTLDAGSLLLVAWKQVGEGASLHELSAAMSLPAFDQPMTLIAVREMREAIAIQALPADSKEREPRLLAALIEGTNILRRYAIAAVGPRAMVARGKGVDLLSRAIASGKTDEDADLALADPLSDTPLFLPEQGEDVLNVRIVTVLASRMIEADAEHAPTWLGYISNCVMTELGVAEGGQEAGQEGEDEADAAKRESAVRTRLIRGVDVPNKAMISRLEKLIAAADGNSEIAAKLNTAWISANGR